MSGGTPHTGSTRQASRRSAVLSSFMLDSFGSSSSTRTKAGTHFGPRSGWPRRNSSKAAGSKVAPLAELQGHHDAVADRVVGDGVDGDRPHVGVAGDDRLHRAGGEVLAVDPQPFVRPAGEVEPAVGVAIGEVAGPVGAVPEALARSPPGCGSSPRSPRSAGSRRSRRPPSSRFMTRRWSSNIARRALCTASRGRAPSPSRRPSRARRRASTGRGG